MSAWAYVERLSGRNTKRIAAGVLSFAVSLKRRSLCFVSVDADGDWSTVQPELRVTSPSPNTIPYSDLVRSVSDLWCHQRRPRLGETIVDVGAGVGDDLVVFSRMVGPTGRVIAIEAHPVTFRCLKKTILANGLSNVTALQLAVGEVDGAVLIDDGATHLASRVGAHGSAVKQQSLDAILSELNVGPIGLLKLNIEGAEWPALRAMRASVARADAVVVSCHDFIADAGGDPSTRTFSNVSKFLRESSLSVLTRPDDHRPWVRYYCYATAK